MVRGGCHFRRLPCGRGGYDDHLGNSNERVFPEILAIVYISTTQSRACLSSIRVNANFNLKRLVCSGLESKDVMLKNLLKSLDLL
jgi:hypothetical protein